ncbi:MAG: MarR family transcriptional regulator [Planctomycetes bacterium]|nr:MarR family transcriptional regulator [Planctomycetota bacterium]
MQRQPTVGDPPSPSEAAIRIHSAAIHVLRRLRQVDSALSLSPARLSALSVIVFAGPVTLTQLGRAEQVSGATITRLVQGLEGSGLARRRMDAEDARVFWIEATPKGKSLLEEGRARRVGVLTAHFSKLSHDDLRALHRSAEILEQVPAPSSTGLPLRGRRR